MQDFYSTEAIKTLEDSLIRMLSPRVFCSYAYNLEDVEKSVLNLRMLKSGK